MTNFKPGYFFKAEDLMNHTGTIPKNHIPASFFNQVCTKIFIRSKNDFLTLWKTFDYLFCITAGTDYITQRFYTGRTVDVSNYYMIRMFVLEFFEQWRRG